MARWHGAKYMNTYMHSDPHVSLLTSHQTRRRRQPYSSTSKVKGITAWPYLLTWAHYACLQTRCRYARPSGGAANGRIESFRDTAYFANGNASLPSPEEVCRAGIKIDDEPVSASRPRPIVFRNLGLLVKFGSEITIAEAQCLWFFNRFMKDKVPTPELYGWRTDGHQVFIYMELIHGDTLKDRWADLSAEDRDVILQELRVCVDAWRELSQEKEPYLIGHIGGQGLGDIIFRDIGHAPPGPFESLQAFYDYFARLSCRLHPEANPRRDWEELEGLTDDRAVVLTHADLDKSNILISAAGDGDPPHVVAIIDWHQSGC